MTQLNKERCMREISVDDIKAVAKNLKCKKAKMPNSVVFFMWVTSLQVYKNQTEMFFKLMNP